jgi:hypothetical protein
MATRPSCDAEVIGPRLDTCRRWLQALPIASPFGRCGIDWHLFERSAALAGDFYNTARTFVVVQNARRGRY